MSFLCRTLWMIASSKRTGYTHQITWPRFVTYTSLGIPQWCLSHQQSCVGRIGTEISEGSLLNTKCFGGGLQEKQPANASPVLTIPCLQGNRGNNSFPLLLKEHFHETPSITRGKVIRTRLKRWGMHPIQRDSQKQKALQVAVLPAHLKRCQV